MKEEKISIDKETELKHHTRRLSIKEGIFWSVRNSFGDQYIAPFAIAIGTSSPLVAILNSLWGLGQTSQVIGSKLMDKFKRKNIFMGALVLESLAWIVLTTAAIFYFKNIIPAFLPYMILLGMAILVLGIGISHPPWFSWMGDVVDARYRGRWFSKRSTIIAFSTIVLALITSTLLTHLKERGLETIGFISLFFIAFLARTYCIKIIKNSYEPKMKKVKKEKSILNFAKKLHGTNLGKFIVFRTILAFTMALSSYITSIYLLRNLGLSYSIYIPIMLAGTFFSVITLNLWGKIADKHGNYRVIALVTILIPLTPIWWILSTNIVYLLLVPTFIGGTIWTAFIMASGNFLYDNTKKQTRGQAISLFNFLVGIGMFLGGVTASFLLKVINTSWIEPIYLIFIIGAILRMIVVSIFVPKLREVTKKRKFKNLNELENEMVKEIKPTLREDFHEIAEIKNYIRER